MKTTPFHDFSLLYIHACGRRCLGFGFDNDRNANSLGIETAHCSQALTRATHSVGGGIKLLHDAF